MKVSCFNSDVETCQRAIDGEQGRIVGGVKWDLKFSRDRGAKHRQPEPRRSDPYRESRYDRNDRYDDRRDYDDRDRRRRRSRSPEPYDRRDRRDDRRDYQPRLPQGVLSYEMDKSTLLDDFHASMLKSVQPDSNGIIKRQDDLNLVPKSGDQVPIVCVICFSVDKYF